MTQPYGPEPEPPYQYGYPPGTPHPYSPHPYGPLGHGPLPPAVHPYSPPGPRRTGAIAWGLGFLAYIPFPFFNLAIAGVVQLCVGLAQRRHGGVAAQNGVRAANWGLTQLTWFVLLAMALAVQYIIDPDGEQGLTPVGYVAIGLMIVYFVLCIVSLVYTIVGLVMARQGRVARCPSIPFIRAPRN